MDTQINIYYSNNPYYPNSSSYPPIILDSFKIADSKICSLPHLYNSALTPFSLEAINKNYSRNCKLNNYPQDAEEDHLIRYHKLDSVDNYELYEENKILDKIRNYNLIKYGYNITKYKQHLLYLYSSRHYGFRKACINERNEKLEMDVYDKLYSRATLMEDFGNNYLFILLNPIINIADFFPQMMSSWIYIGFSAIGKIVDYIYVITNTWEAVFFYNIPYSEEMNCSDAYTNDIYNIMTYKVKKGGIFIKITYILSIVIGIINIAILILEIVGKRKETNNNNIDTEQRTNLTDGQERETSPENGNHQENRGFQNDKILTIKKKLKKC